MNSSKTRCICFLVAFVCLLLFLGGLTVLIDPFFHYHGPLSWLQYPIDNQRYQNDGIVKHFDYDAIITGTSMTENFKASEFNGLFGVNSVKTCFSGATYKEINDHLLRAVNANKNIKIILRGLDGWGLFDDKDLMRTDAAFPDYLYDDLLFNDVQYLFNKDIFCNYTLEALKHTVKGLPTTDFDTYSTWDDSRTGFHAIMTTYSRPADSGENQSITQEETENLMLTVEQNIIAIARENPDIQFYYFFTPYSIFYMDEQHQYGTLLRQFQGYQLATEMLLEYDNIHLFSFFTDYDTITNPENYKDISHYTAAINSQILERMANGEYQLTQENYKKHWSEVTAFYTAYDFDSLFE